MAIQHLSCLSREYGVTTDEIVALTEGMGLVAYVEDGVAYAYTRKDADKVEQIIRLSALEKAAARRAAAGRPGPDRRTAPQAAARPPASGGA